MKQEINPTEIRKGDLIRIETVPPRTYKAIEYRASSDTDRNWYDDSTYYLLERPEPPFEPYWGMVIVSPMWSFQRAVYTPVNHSDATPWASVGDVDDLEENGWRDDKWAKQKLAEGWKVLEKPEWAP